MERGLSVEALERAEAKLRDAMLAAGIREAEDLAREAVTVLDGAVAAQQPHAGEVDLCEAHALGALLGRRLALVGVSPSSALLVIDAIAEHGAVGDVPALRSVVIEGYASGLRDASVAELEGRIASQVEMLALAPGLVLVPVPYLEDVDRMSLAMDAVGRTLLSRDVKGCVIWAQAVSPQREEAMATGIAALVEHARMVGARVNVVVPDGGLRERISSRLSGPVSLMATLLEALDEQGYALREGGILRRWLSR